MLALNDPHVVDLTVSLDQVATGREDERVIADGTADVALPALADRPDSDEVAVT